MPKNKKQPVVAVDQATLDRLASVAKQRATSRSKVVKGLVDRYLDDDDSVVVVLRIPRPLLADPDELGRWLRVRADAVCGKLTC